MTTDIIRVIFLLPACGLLGVAILRDIAARIIPNRLCAGVAALALALHAACGDWMAALLAGMVVFLIAYVCWMRGWLGGGDVKLLTATAMLVPPGNVPALLGAVAVAGGALGVCYLVLARFVGRPCERAPARLLPRILRAERWRIRGGRSLPYACAIAAGAFITLLNG